ncbi:hypothetical protein FQN53_001174 [Emmonsiellopsis sp. PD_33]|nr:hypothetical protein FQN53_001174 [Emmonsiellopsis sp. PD_33]KAK2799030.1 hypothetical protein FQN51_007135 [Onygenales sp. PD_10]
MERNVNIPEDSQRRPQPYPNIPSSSHIPSSYHPSPSHTTPSRVSRIVDQFQQTVIAKPNNPRQSNVESSPSTSQYSRHTSHQPSDHPSFLHPRLPLQQEYSVQQHSWRDPPTAPRYFPPPILHQTPHTNRDRTNPTPISDSVQTWTYRSRYGSERRSPPGTFSRGSNVPISPKPPVEIHGPSPSPSTTHPPLVDPYAQSWSETSAAGGHLLSRTQSSISTATEINFVYENPSRGGSTTYRRPKIRTADDRRRKQLLADMGGTCCWCAQRKKPCDPSEVCIFCRGDDSSSSFPSPCIRSPGQLSLYCAPAVSSPQDRKAAADSAKDQTFMAANKLLRELEHINSQSAPENAEAQVIVQIQGATLEMATLVIPSTIPSDTPSNNYILSKNEWSNLIDNALCTLPPTAIPTTIPRFNGDGEYQSMLFTAMHMHRIFTFVINITQAGLHVRPGDYRLSQVVLAGLFASLAKRIAELSEKFSEALIKQLRKLKTKDYPKQMYVATRLYQATVIALSKIEHRGIARDIFSGMLGKSESVLSLIGLLLKTRGFARFNLNIPPPSIYAPFKLALFLQTNSPVPTGYGGLDNPFDTPVLATVGDLLSSPLENGIPFEIQQLPVANSSLPGLALQTADGQVSIGIEGPGSQIRLLSPRQGAHNDLGARWDDAVADLQVRPPSLSFSQQDTLVETETDVSTQVGIIDNWIKLDAKETWDDLVGYDTEYRDFDRTFPVKRQESVDSAHERQLIIG